MFEAHQQRIVDLNEELAAIDTEIAGVAAQRRGKPTQDQEARTDHLRSRRSKVEAALNDLVEDLAHLQLEEQSEARKAQRARGRALLAEGLRSVDQRVQLAQELDSAAAAFLAAMDRINAIGADAQAAVCEAARAAAPRWQDQYQAQQRRLMIEGTSPHAGGFTSHSTQYALVLFIAQLLERVENPKGIAQVATGWQFTSETRLGFADATRMAAESMGHGGQRIVAGLAEPK